MARYPRNYRKIIKLAPLLISMLIAALYSLYHKTGYNIPSQKFSLSLKANYDYNNILVTSVADGDTIKVEDGSWVRLIGIDTPEYHTSEKLFREAKRAKKDIETIKKLGARAKSFTEEILSNKMVRLEFDVEKRDKYGRLLAYVFLEDGTFVNAKIVEAGYAKIMTIPPNVKYADMFKNLQTEAKSQNKGLWGDYINDK